jgi:hypothetical protein
MSPTILHRKKLEFYILQVVLNFCTKYVDFSDMNLRFSKVFFTVLGENCWLTVQNLLLSLLLFL